MYKNPELTEKAKRLRTVLASLNLPLSHAQALEACSRLEGARTLHVAQASKPAKAAEPEDAPLFQGPMLDWTVHDNDGNDIPEHRQARYEVKVQRSQSQFFVDITPEGLTPDDLSGQHQMSLFIEVNEGLPCVHITNDVLGDQVLTVFATNDGLYLRPDSSDLAIRTGVLNSELEPSLSELHMRETAGLPSFNRAFIVASNKHDI